MYTKENYKKLRNYIQANVEQIQYTTQQQRQETKRNLHQERKHSVALFVVLVQFLGPFQVDGLGLKKQEPNRLKWCMISKFDDKYPDFLPYSSNN